MNNIDVKNIIVDVLTTDAQQSISLLRLEKMGVNLETLMVEYLDNMLDLIGFPRSPQALSVDPYYILKDGEFCRDYISQKFFDEVISLYETNIAEKRSVGDILLNIDENDKIRERVIDFVNWAYFEYDRLFNDKS